LLAHQRVLGTDVRFSYAFVQLLVDFRLFPLLAALCFLATLILLRGGVPSLPRAKLPFFAGLGLGIFSIFRYFLVEAYRRTPVWLDFWEEATELVLTVALGFFLLTFREQLGLGRPRVRPSE
jgi:drug/metabolite transporter (DMT)-like permease